MLSAVPVLLSLQSPPSEVDILLRRVAIERGRYGEVHHPTNEAYEPDYQLASPTMMVFFPVGDWQQRYCYKLSRASLSSTWKARGKIEESWYVRLTRATDRPIISGIGTLDALLGRDHEYVKSGSQDALVQKTLNKKQPYAGYAYRILAERMTYWFVDANGRSTSERDAPYDIHSSQPYPITPEERKYWDEDAYLGICAASDKLAVFRLLSDRAFHVKRQAKFRNRTLFCSKIDPSKGNADRPREADTVFREPTASPLPTTVRRAVGSQTGCVYLLPATWPRYFRMSGRPMGRTTSLSSTVL